MTAVTPRRRQTVVPFRRWLPVMILMLAAALTAVWLMARSTPVNPDAVKQPATADSTGAH